MKSNGFADEMIKKDKDIVSYLILDCTVSRRNQTRVGHSDLYTPKSCSKFVSNQFRVLNGVVSFASILGDNTLT